MATRKKKTTLAKAQVLDDRIYWPKVTVGSHLTVTEHEDGRTTLEWDDEALLREVKEATASVEGKKDASVSV